MVKLYGFFMTFNNRSYLVYFFIILSLLFSLFPWLSFSLNSFDMQPWVLFLYAIVVGFFICHRVHIVIILFYLFFFVCCFFVYAGLWLLFC